MSEKTKTFNYYGYDSTTERAEQEPQAGKDHLRDAILESSVTPFARIPDGAVAIELSSDNLTQENLGYLSGYVEDTKEKWHEGQIDEIRDRLTDGDYVGTLRSKALKSREEGVLTKNVTLLYDSDRRAEEDEVLAPSTVLVHERLRPEQIQELRAQLPEGVPLMDSRTHELLDKVGAEQREKAHIMRKFRIDLGRFSLWSFDKYAYTGQNRNRSRSSQHVDFDWMRPQDWSDFNESANRVYEEYEASKGGWDDEHTFKGDYGDWDPWQEFDYGTPKPPESEEVRVHRERVEKAEGLLNDAAGKYGASKWRDLDPRDQERVRRNVLRDVHPDREGGDKKLFQEVEFMTQNIRKDSQEKTEPTPSAEEQPASHAEPKAEPSQPESAQATTEQEPAEEAREPLQIEASEAEKEAIESVEPAEGQDEEETVEEDAATDDPTPQ
jgi:hypothetical protein